MSAHVCSFALILLLAMSVARADEIPHEAARYRLDLTRQARLVWGLDAPVASFAAQIHTESKWRADAVSPVGARGLAQFMPASERWISGVYLDLNTSSERSSTGADASGRSAPAGATNPAWAIRALVTYDKFLYDRANGLTACDSMWMALWGYNGGETWRKRDQALAAKHGADIHLARDVEPFNAGRSAAAFRENRAYPRLILKVREPLYESAGWGEGVCP